jgi:hypothetical protein
MRRLYISLFFAGLVPFINAQTEKQYLPSEMKQKTVILEPPTLYKGFFKAGLTYAWTSVNSWYDADGKKTPVPGSGYYATRSILSDFRYGITDRLTVHLGVPYTFMHMYQSVEQRLNLQDLVNLKKWDRKGYGLGDVDLGADFQLLTEKENRPAITLKTFVTFPTGEKNPTDSTSQYEFKEPTGRGEYSLMGILQTRKVVYPWYLDLSLYYTHFLGGEKMQALGEPETGFQGGDLSQIAGTLGYQVNDWICLNNMVSLNLKSKDTYDDVNYAYLEYKSHSIDYYFYLYFQIKRLRLVQSVFVPLLGKSWGADPGYFIMMSYAF